MTIPVTIFSSRLTTCAVLEDGEAVQLDLVDASGTPVALQFPFEQAQALAMTLPRLLTDALKARTASETARYVFPLGKWSIESTTDQRCLMVTLTTTDGFEVTFAIPLDTGFALGWTLKQEAEDAIESGAVDAEPPDYRSQLN